MAALAFPNLSKRKKYHIDVIVCVLLGDRAKGHILDVPGAISAEREGPWDSIQITVLEFLRGNDNGFILLCFESEAGGGNG
jgi:hypothetical protein